MITGKIKSVKSKGFGFIETPMGIDFFFHQSNFTGDFKDLLKVFALGDKPKVQFDQDESSDKGPRAVNISIVKE